MTKPTEWREQPDGTVGPDNLAKRERPKCTDLSRRAIERVLRAAKESGDLQLTARLQAKLDAMDDELRKD